MRTGGEEEEEREGGQGGGCSCGPSLPTCSSTPEQAAQLVRNQAAPASIEPRGRGSPPTGGPGAPWMWLHRRLHLIPFAEQADPSVKPPRHRGRTEGERREDGGEGKEGGGTGDRLKGTEGSWQRWRAARRRRLRSTRENDGGRCRRHTLVKKKKNSAD